MKKFARMITSAAVAFSVTLTLAVSDFIAPVVFGDTSAYAQNQAPQTRPKRRTEALRNHIFERLSKAQEKADAGDVRGALEDAQDVLGAKGLNAYETALVHRYLFGFYYDLENEQQAIQHLRTALQQPNIPYSFEDSLRFALAQMYTAIGDYQSAIRELNDWFQYQANPLPNAYFLRGQLYYQQGLETEKQGRQEAARDLFRRGITDVEHAIDAKALSGGDPQESWYSILSAMYYSLGDIPKVAELLEFIIVRWPRAQYWSQLAAMYSNMNQETKQLAVMDVAYRLGFLEKENNLVNMAQLYSFHESPYLGAKVLQKGMRDTRVNDDGETVPLVNREDAANHKILGQALLQAREYRESAPHLEIAAAAEEDGELYIQLGHVYSTLEDWEGAAQAMQNAIDKGDLRREDQAYLYLGQAYFNLNQFDRAERAFRQARRDERSRKTVQGWLRYITSEKARRKRLADAGLL